MKIQLATFVCVCQFGILQLGAQIQLEHPSQFYTNGTKIDAWTRNDQQRLSSTFWLVKNPANSLNYRQQVVIVYDSDPSKLYYYDVATELFIGRYDMQNEGYSLLRPEDRRPRIQDIRKTDFPDPGEKPRVSEMFDPVSAPNHEQLMMPPATMTFPRLSNSKWSGFYTDIGANRRRKMDLTLNGNRGRYEARDVGIKGDLYNIVYDYSGKMPMIRGRWSSGGNVGGGFAFQLMSLGEFQGDYWVGNNQQETFLWDGKRVSR